MISVKRVYEEPIESDGERILVDRLWPRGISRADARFAGWLKDLAPSPSLRQWFNHDRSRWAEFQERYRAELAAADKQPQLRELIAKAARVTVTLLFAAQDVEHNNAVVLKNFLEGQLSALPNPMLYQSIVENTPDAVILADQEGVIRIWNKGAQILFGYDASEAIGQTLDLIVPERQRARHWEGYRRVMSTGVSRYGAGDLLAVPAIRKDGTRISIEFTVTLVHDDTGELLGPAAIIRDVTERWQADRALKERLALLEAQLVSPAEGTQRRTQSTRALGGSTPESSPTKESKSTSFRP